MALTPEQQAELNKLTLKDIALKKKAQELNDEELAYLNQKLTIEKRTVEQHTEYLASVKELAKTQDVRQLQLQAEIDLQEAIYRKEVERFNNGEATTAEQMKQLDILRDELNAKREVLDVQDEINEEINRQNSISAKSEKIALKLLTTTRQQVPALLGAKAVQLAATGITRALSSIVATAKEVFLAFNENTTAFEKQFNVGQSYKQQITDTYLELDTFGASIEDVTNTYGAFITNFTDFTLASQAQRKSLADTAVLLQRGYGIAQEDVAAGVQSSTKAFGLSIEQSKDFQTEIVSTAEALGMSSAALSAKFASMGPDLAKFGADGTKAFKDLARLSKLTGMEMEKLLAITSKFDTFEGAAERAGMLNAALGGNFVNAMDLMMATDPAERFMMIRDAIDQTGLSFDEMGYYQKQFFAEAAGLDSVNDLALLMSGNMDLLNGSTNQSAKSIEEQAKRAQEMMTIMESLKSVFVDMVGPIVKSEEGIKGFVQSFTEGLKEAKKIVIGVGLAIGGLLVLFGVLAARRKARLATAVMEIASSLKSAGADAAETAAIGAQTTAIQANTAAKRANLAAGPGPLATGGPAAAAAIPKFLALAAAAGLLGIGLGAAGAGMSLLVDSVKGLTTDEFFMLAGIIGTLTIAIIALAGALALMGNPITMAGAAVLAGLGVAAGAIGALLGVFKKEKNEAEEMAKVFEKLGGVDLDKAQIAFKSISASINTTQIDQLEGYSKMAGRMALLAATPAGIIMAPAIANVLMRNTSPATQATPAAGPQQLATTASGDGKVLGEIKITFDNAMFDDKVVKLVKNEGGLEILDAVENRGGR